MATVELTNVGPVERLALPIPEDGGVVVIRGRNGSGKSTTLEATRALLGGKVDVSARDNTARGVCEGFGVRVSFAATTRRSGELEAVHLEGRLNVADLVDPGLKSADAADTKRIKALLAVQGVKADVADFYSLVGSKEEFDKLVSPRVGESDDPVAMAAQVKRDLEAAARKAEEQAQHALGRARECKSAVEGIDMTAARDAIELQNALEMAIGRHASIDAQISKAQDTENALADARTQLEQAKAGGDRITVDQATVKMQCAANDLQAVRDHIAALTLELTHSQQQERLADQRHEHAQQRLTQAKQQQQTIDAAEAVLASTVAQAAPSLAELNAAASAVTGARVAIEKAAVARRAQAKLSEASSHENTAKAQMTLANALRDAAKDTDSVLSGLVGSSVLRVEAGRLVTDTSRGPTLYSELSDGERWRIALELAAERVGKGGIIVVPQVAWEGLDPTNRKLVADHARRLRVVILTAEADDCDLAATEFSAN